MRIALVAALALTATAALASEQTACQAVGGRLLTGRVVGDPWFKPGKLLKGVELSHTHLTLRSDADGGTYDVAIDNVFASGYDAAGEAIPAPLDGIQRGEQLELCGKPYSEGGGIDWVHTNCGDTLSPERPDGWVKRIGPNGELSANLESNQEYCGLWPRQ